MPEIVSVAEAKSHLIVHSSGPISLAEFKLTITAINYYYRNFRIDKVLVDGRSRDEIPNNELALKAGQFLAEETQGNMKFAILISHTPSDHGFFKSTVDINGGVIEYFNCEEEALQWLEV